MLMEFESGSGWRAIFSVTLQKCVVRHIIVTFDLD